jgi:hypothetical protein
VAAFGVVVSDVMADFEPGFSMSTKASVVEQFNFQQTPKGFGMRVVVAVALPGTTEPSPARQGPMRASKSLKWVNAYWLPWSECTIRPAAGWRTASAGRRASLTRASDIVSRNSQPTTLREQRSSHVAK